MLERERTKSPNSLILIQSHKASTWAPINNDIEIQEQKVSMDRQNTSVVAQLRNEGNTLVKYIKSTIAAGT